MVKISEEVKEFLRTHLAFVATSDLRNMPNVVPKGDVAVIDEHTLVFADLYAHQTKENLARNPHISICVVNPASYTGYQLKGKAKIVERGKEYEELSRQASGAGQLGHRDAKYAVKVTVDKIVDIGYTHTADQEIGR